MGETVNLACLDCRVFLWIGQRSAGNATPYLYTTAEHIAALNVFLTTHRGHLLSCVRDNDAFMREVDGRDIKIALEEFSPSQVSAMASPRRDF